MTAYSIDNVGPTGPPGASAALYWGASDFGAVGAKYLLAFGQSIAAPTTEALSETTAEFPGTLQNLQLKIDVAIASDVTVTIRVNGVDSALTCTLTAGGTLVADTTHTVAVVAGDVLSCKSVIAGAGSLNIFPNVTVEFA